MSVNNSLRCFSQAPSQAFVHESVAILPKYDLFQNLQLGPFLHSIFYGTQGQITPRPLVPYGAALLEQFVLDTAFYIGACKDIRNDPFLAGMDIEIVEAPSTSRQITMEDYLGMKALYAEIAAGRTFLRVEGSRHFRSQFLSAVRKLMQRPSGRAIIISLCRSAYPIDIHQGEISECHPPGSTKRFRLILNLDTTFAFPCLTPEGEWRFVPCDNYIVLAHEAIHLLHLMHFLNSPSADYHATIHMGWIPYPDLNYTNIMERLTICGDAPNGELVADVPEYGLICENLVRYEFDEPLRYGHMGSVFLPFKEEDKAQINEKSPVNSWTRVEEAALRGLYDEVKMLLDFGADPQDGLRGGVKAGISKIINLCLDRGASFPVLKQ